MDVKIRHKLIEIEDRVSDRFVILVTNCRWFRILEVIRYRRSNRPILKNTRQIYKISSFIIQRRGLERSSVLPRKSHNTTENLKQKRITS